MKIQVLDNAKKKKFIAELSGFGLKKIPQMLVRSGKERIRAFSGSLSREEIMEIWRMFPIEGVGLYVGKEFVNRSGVREVRLSVDGIQMLLASGVRGSGCRGVGRVVVLTEEQEEEWFLGHDIEVESDLSEGFVLVKSGGDFVGMGKLGSKTASLSDRKTGFPVRPVSPTRPFRCQTVGESGVRILYSFLPKERRRRERG